MLRFYIDHDDDGTPFGHLGGEMDVGAVQSLTEGIEETAARVGNGDVILDLEAVTFIDSSCVRALLEAHGRFVSEGRHLVLRHPSPPVARVVEILGLGDRLTLAPDAVHERRDRRGSGAAQ